MRLIMLFASFLCACTSKSVPPPPPGATPVETARAVLADLQAGRFDVVVARFNDEMRAAFGAGKLRQVWSSVTGPAGELRRERANRTVEKSGHHIVILTLEYALGSFDLRMSFDAQQRIAGFFINPPSPEGKYQKPDYVVSSIFEERKVRVGSAPWELPGTLAVPKGMGPFPAVVLVHGSGAHDRDETIGSNKPFRDLAQGLASRGVATLRYEKRNKLYGEALAKLPRPTLREETIDDALAAVALLRRTATIDPGRIVVVGHSLGGYAIPRIGVADEKIAAFVVLAGSTRPFEVLLPAQVEYILDVKKAPAEVKAKQLAALRAEIAKMTAPDLTPDSALTVMGMPASYFLDLRGYKPQEVAKKLARPMLILQGERDYQVTVAGDFAGWKEALSGKPEVTFKVYPALNHLFIAGTGTITPDEYLKAGNVARVVVEDIAAFAKSVAARK